MKHFQTPAIVLCVLFAAMLACAQPLPTSEPMLPPNTPQPEAAIPTLELQTPGVEVAPTDAPLASSAGLGQVAKQDGYSLSAVTLEDPTKPDIAMYEPSAGLRLLAVELVLGSESGNTVKVNPLYSILVDSQGREYEPVLGRMADHNDVELTDLAAGQELRGWVAFEVPEGVSPAFLRYTFDLFKGPTVQVGLLR